MDRKASLDALVDGLFVVRIRVRAPDVVFVKGIVEASEGLAQVLAEPRAPGDQDHDGGALVIAAPHSRSAEVLGVVAELREALGGALWDEPAALHGASACLARPPLIL